MAALLSLGHHLDHVLRGDHTGWPLTGQVTPFTFSLVVYPLILFGLHLSRTGRAGPGFWLWVSGPGALFLVAVHLGPTAIERPEEILDGHATRELGWAAFAWLLTLMAVLAATFVHELRCWLRQRRLRALGPVQDRPHLDTSPMAAADAGR